MSRKKERIKIEGATHGNAIIQSIKHGEEGIVIKLHFDRLDLSIQEETNKVLHEIKRICGCTTAQAISFLMNAGTIIFKTIKSEFEKVNPDVRKKDENNNSD